MSQGYVFRLAGTVGNYGCITRTFGHFNGIQRFGQCSDLIELDKNGVGALGLNILGLASRDW